MKQPLTQCLRRFALVLAAVTALAACQGKQEPLPQYSIGGTVSGLVSTVVLQNNGGDDITLRSNGPFTFATSIKRGDDFAVTVLTQPVGQTCNVTNGAGVASENVTDVLVTCTGGGAFYTVGGTVSGLDGAVELRFGTQSVTVTRSGFFTFATAVRSGTPYAVTVATQPADQTCTVTNGTGIVVDANVTNVQVTCVDNLPPPPAAYSIGGTVSGLSGGTLRLGLERPGSTNVAIDVTANGPFSFGAATVVDGSRYTVSVLAEPTGQGCSVKNGNGTARANVTDVEVTCKDDAGPPPPATHSIGGTVSGLSGGTLQLGLQAAGSAGGSLAITSNGAFTFAAEVADGASYTVTVATQPANQACAVTNGSGTALADVTNVLVQCTTTIVRHSIGGTVSGLSGGTLQLGLQAAGSAAGALDVTSNGAFTFAAEVEDGASYAVTVVTQPADQECTVTNGSGTARADVTNVIVECTTLGRYSVGGTIEGLTGAGLTIEDGTANGITPDAGASSFTLPVAYDDGAVYDVGVSSQPVGQTCVITRSHGAIAGEDVANVSVVCIDNVTDPLVGTYAVAESGADDLAYLTLFADGVYVYGSVENDAGCGGTSGNGVEYGAYTYDATTGFFAIRNAVVDTNGSCGVWDGTSRYTGLLTSSGGGPNSTLTLTVLGRGIFELRPVESKSNEIYGSFADAYHRNFWVFTDAGSDTLYVFNTQTQADEGATSQGYAAGVEYACGAIVEGSDSGGTLATDFGATCQAPAPVIAGAVDTNGSSGLSGVAGSWTFDVAGNDLVGATFSGRRIDPN